MKIDSTKENIGDPYVVRASSSTPKGHNAEFTLITTEGTYVDTFTFTIVIGTYNYLVWNPDPTPVPGRNIDSILIKHNYAGVYSTTLPVTDLGRYEAIFVCLGMYPNRYVIVNGSAEANALVNYLNSGGRMYMEGSDVWYYDPGYANGYDFGPLFGIQGLADGTGDLSPVIGENGTFTRNMNFAYGGENSYVDHIDPIGTGFLIFHDGDNAYNCGVANNPGVYRTVGTSFELGLLYDGAVPSTRAVLLDSIMMFFGIASTDETPPSAPFVTQARKSGNNAVLTWNKVITDTSGHTETTHHYVVYRNTSPSFVPGHSDSIGYANHPDTTYADINALSASSSYYYLVKAVDTASHMSRKSNMAFVLHRTVNENPGATDKNWVSLPFKSNYSTVSQLANDLSPGGDPLIKITNLTDAQGYQNWLWDPEFGEWSGLVDYSIEPGRALEMVTVRDTVVVLVGASTARDSIRLNENPGATDKNWVSIPYNAVYSYVSQLANDAAPTGDPLIKITNLTDAQAYQNYLWDPEFGEWSGLVDFAIERGRGYEFVTMRDTYWKPTVYSNTARDVWAGSRSKTSLKVYGGNAAADRKSVV